MPIKELLAIATIALAGIFAAHPFDFSNAVRRVELSILKEASRTDNWYDCRQPFFGECSPSHSGVSRSLHKHSLRTLKTVPRT
jgi:hypothetical protein